MSEAKTGDFVKVHYTGSLADGTQFDSSQGQDPLAFTLGEGNMIPGFEQAVMDRTSSRARARLGSRLSISNSEGAILHRWPRLARVAAPP